VFMNIDFLGLDMYIVAELSKEIEQKIHKLLKLPLNDIIITGSETILYHGGIDQNSWHTIVKINILDTYKDKQNELAKAIYSVIKPHTIHVKMIFEYFKSEETVTYRSDDYPLFVTEDNHVELVTPEVNPKQEIYHGNAFTPHQKALESIKPSTETCEDGLCEGEEAEDKH